MQEITFSQKLKIEAEVARIIENIPHEAGQLLEVFKKLKFCDDNLQEYYTQCFCEYISESDLSNIFDKIFSYDYFYDYWINSVLEYINLYRELNSKIYEKEIKYTFYCYIDKISELDFFAAKQLLNAVIKDNRFEFLKQISIVKLQELQCNFDKKDDCTKYVQTEENYRKVLSLAFNPDDEWLYLDEEQKHLSHRTNLEILNDIEDISEKIELLLLDIIENELPYEVQRISKETQEIEGTKTFPTKIDAEIHLKEKLTGLPELMNFYEYKIVRKE